MLMPFDSWTITGSTGVGLAWMAGLPAGVTAAAAARAGVADVVVGVGMGEGVAVGTGVGEGIGVGVAVGTAVGVSTSCVASAVACVVPLVLASPCCCRKTRRGIGTWNKTNITTMTAAATMTSDVRTERFKPFLVDRDLEICGSLGDERHPEQQSFG